MNLYGIVGNKALNQGDYLGLEIREVSCRSVLTGLWVEDTTIPDTTIPRVELSPCLNYSGSCQKLERVWKKAPHEFECDTEERHWGYSATSRATGYVVGVGVGILTEGLAISAVAAISFATGEALNAVFSNTGWVASPAKITRPANDPYTTTAFAEWVDC